MENKLIPKEPDVKEDKSIYKKPEIILRPGSTGGIMPCHRTGINVSGGIMPCYEYPVDFGGEIFEEFRKRRNEKNEEKIFENFVNFYNTTYK